jgi:hypothetical protein
MDLVAYVRSLAKQQGPASQAKPREEEKQ